MVAFGISGMMLTQRYPMVAGCVLPNLTHFGPKGTHPFTHTSRAPLPPTLPQDTPPGDMSQEDKVAEARRKNREAQQRFRERQRAAVREVEEQYQAVSAGLVIWAWLGAWLGMVAWAWEAFCTWKRGCPVPQVPCPCRLLPPSFHVFMAWHACCTNQSCRASRRPACPACLLCTQMVDEVARLRIENGELEQRWGLMDLPGNVPRADA